MPQLDPEVATNLKFEDGTAIVPALKLKLKSTGDDGQYDVQVTANADGVAPLKIPFDYSNDAKLQEERTKLLESKKRKYDRLIKVNEKVREQEELKDKARMRVGQIVAEINELYAKSLNNGAHTGDNKLDLHGIAAAIERAQRDLANAKEQLQRSNRNPPLRNPVADTDVLGTVASFGRIEDDIMCHLISWAMQNNMNTLIVPTPAVANKHHARRCLPVTRLLKSPASRGRERPSNAPADATRYGGDFMLNHITLVEDVNGQVETAAKVFTQLLGTALFFPNQRSADEYYKSRKGRAGTIYYLGGDSGGRMGRIESSGVQGGRSNSPPAFNANGFSTFAKPTSHAAAVAVARIQYLQHLKELMTRRNQAYQSQQQIEANEAETEYRKGLVDKEKLEHEIDQLEQKLEKRPRDDDNDAPRGGGGGGKRARTGRGR